MAFILKEKDEGEDEIGDEPCHDEWHENTAQVVDGYDSENNTKNYYQASDKTVKCYFFVQHNLLLLTWFGAKVLKLSHNAKFLWKKLVKSRSVRDCHVLARVFKFVGFVRAKRRE